MGVSFLVENFPSSYNVIGQRVSSGNQKRIVLASFKASYSHKICWASSSGWKGVLRRGLKMLMGKFLNDGMICCCQSGQFVIPPARKRSTLMPVFGVGAVITFICLILA